MASIQLRGRSAERRDPLSREALFRQVGALVGAVMLGFLSMAVREAEPEQSRMLVQASTATAVIVMITVIVPWHRLPALTHSMLPMVFLGVAYLARLATGGLDSAYAQLTLLPILWVAVYGTRREVVGVFLAAAAVLAVPMVPAGPGPTLPQTLALLVGGGAVAFTVHRFFDGIRRQTTRLQAYAGTDPLTGAANRRTWDEELSLALTRSIRDGLPVSVALLDMDDFKAYNDRFGHQAGDRLLKEAAAAWRNILRASDILARVGGDEFAVLLPGCPLDEAAAIANRLRASVPESVHCSVGVAAWDGQEGTPRLVARADRALYGAKERGRDCVVIIPENGRATVEVAEEEPAPAPERDERV
jgi:diguanylate cyclase (GGDEF)-like protein